MNPVRRTTHLLALGVALSCLIAPRSGQAQCGQNHFTVIDVPGAPSTVVTGLNNLGQVVGSYQSDGLTRSFVWWGGRFISVNAPSSVTTVSATSINDWGQIVGQQVSSDFGQGGFVFDWFRFSRFDNPNAVVGLTFPQSINDVGQVAGFFVGSDFKTSAFIYHQGKFKTVKPPVTSAITTAVNSINNDGQIAGYYVAPQSDGSFMTQSFMSVKGKNIPMTVPGTAGFSVATGINDWGQVVGYYLGSDFLTHGFLYSGGRYTTFDAPVAGSQGTYPGGINDLGQISGEYVDSNYQTHGFLFD